MVLVGVCGEVDKIADWVVRHSKSRDILEFKTLMEWEAKKWKKRAEILIIIGVAGEVLCLAFSINDSAKLYNLTEVLRKQNNELRAKLQPRRLTGSDRTALAKLLSNPPWGIVIVSTEMDGESADFADDFDATFHEAHWQTRRWDTFTDNWNGVFVGMLNGSADTAQMQKIKDVSAALTAIGVPNEERTIDEAHRQRMSPWFETNVLYLVIGHKPRAVLEEQPEK
jgi:hypothetical protein